MKNAIVYKLLFIVSFILLSLFTSCRIIQDPSSIKLISTYTTRIIPTETKKKTDNFQSQTLPLKNSVQKEMVFGIFQTREYKVYTGLKQEATVLNTYAEKDLQLADELKAKAYRCSYAAQQLVDSSDLVSNKKVKKELLERAEWLDKAFVKLIAVSDSIREVGRNSDAAWYSKRVEAELFVQSVDQNRYDQIMALYNVLDVEKIRAMAMNDTNGSEK